MFLRSFSIIVLIVFSILAPYLSLLQAGGVDGMVYIVIPRSFVRWFEAQGYSLGSISVAMLSPLDYEGYSYWLRDVVGGRFELDFRRVAWSWFEFYQSDSGKESLKTSPPIPTVSITITLSRYTGDRVLECVAHYTYSTVDYFIEKGLNLVEAIENARRDPIAHLRRPLVITLAPRMPKGELKPTCGDLTPAVEGMKKVMDRIVGVARGDAGGFVEAPHLMPQSSCPARYTEVWWSGLYSDRDNPPSGWMSNVYRYDGVRVPDEHKMRAWRAYATNYSLAYYYRTDDYSLEDSKAYTLYELSFRSGNPLTFIREGLYSMDPWIDRVFKILYGPPSSIPVYAWKDYHESNPNTVTEWSDYQPYFGMRMENPNKKPFDGLGAFAVGSTYYKHGVTLLGFYLVGTESLALNIPVTLPSSVSGDVIKSYMGIRTSYKYVGEGFILHLDVSKVKVNVGGVACEYWRVVPINGIVPVYSVRMDLTDVKVFDNSEPPFYDEVLYSATVDTVYYAYVSNVKAGTRLYEESNSDVARVASEPSLASIASNLLSNALDYTIANLACKSPSPSCLFFSVIAGSFVSYSYGDLHKIAIAYSFTLRADNDVDDAIVQIDKVTLWYANNTYSSLGWRPLMVEFRIYIDVVGAPPPCSKYCPYHREDASG